MGLWYYDGQRYELFLILATSCGVFSESRGVFPELFCTFAARKNDND
jgi:hypothetical protein